MAARDINSIMAGWVDRGPWQYCDTVRAPSSTILAAQYQHSQLPSARVIRTSATSRRRRWSPTCSAETNSLPRVVWSSCRSVFILQSQMVKSDIDLLVRQCGNRSRIDDKIYMEGQLWQFPAGVGMAALQLRPASGVSRTGSPHSKRPGGTASTPSTSLPFSSSLTQLLRHASDSVGEYRAGRWSWRNHHGSFRDGHGNVPSAVL